MSVVGGLRTVAIAIAAASTLLAVSCLAQAEPNQVNGQGQYAAAVLADGPTAFWPLGGSGGLADQGPSGVSAGAEGAVRDGQPGPVADSRSASLSFDGTGSVTSSSAIDVGVDFTIEAWVKASSANGQGTIVSLFDGTESRTLFLDHGHFVGMMDLSAAWPAFSVQSTDIDPTLWHHVAFSARGGSNLTIYVDGVLSGTSAIASRNGLSAPVVMGGSSASHMAHFSGLLADVAVYPTALAADRVSAHFMASGEGCRNPLQSLLDAASPGSVVNIPPCLYRETVTVSKPMIVSGQQGTEIRGSDVWTDWAKQNSLWVSQQQVPTLPVVANPQDGRCADGTAQRCLRPQQVFIDGKALQPVATGSSPTSDQFELDATRHVVLADDPSGHTVEVSTRQRWIVTRSDGVTIQGITMRQAANDALTGAISNDGHANWTLQSSTLSDAHGADVSIHNASNLAVLNNDIGRAGDMGVHGTALTDSRIEGNHIRNNNTDQFNRSWGAGGLKITQARRVEVNANEVDNNTGTGLWCDISCSDVTFATNRVHDNLDAGVLFEISDGASIRANVVWNNGWGLDKIWGGGIVISTSANADVSGNTVAWNAAGIVVVEQMRESSVPVHNVRIHDNSIVATSGTTALSWQAPTHGQGSLGPQSGNGGARNRYWFPNPDGASIRFLWGGGSSGSYSKLADFMRTPGESDATYLSDGDKNDLLAAAGIPSGPPVAAADPA